MNKKLGVLFFVAVIALASLGISYAQEDYVDFVQSGYWDNDDNTKNIGSVFASISPDGEILDINIQKAYPGYEANVSFVIQHIGTEGDPIAYLNEIAYTNNNPTKLNVVVTDPDGNPILIDTPLEWGETLAGLVTITILDGAEMNIPLYEFGVAIIFRYE